MKKDTMTINKIKSLAVFAAAALAASASSYGQLQIGALDTPTVITFDASSPGLATATAYNGTGISTDVAGNLAAGVWAARVSTDGTFNWNPMIENPNNANYGFFGTAQPAVGSLRRGAQTPTTGTSGIGYADISASRTLSVKTGNIAADYIYIAVQNTTGSTVTSWSIDYDAWRTNQTAGVATASFVYSAVTAVDFVNGGPNPSFTNVAALSFQTLGTAVAAGTFEAVSFDAQTISASVAHNDYFIFGWQILQSGNNTETLAFDNISIAAVPEPSTAALLALGGAGLLMLRRMRNRA